MSSFWSYATFYKLIKFGVVGFSGLVVDFGFTYLFRDILKVNQYVANGIGFCLAATSNYFLNRIWTFHSLNPDITFEYLRFFGVSLIGLGINSFVLWFLIKKFKMKFYMAKAIAIGVTTLWNFIANLLFTFVN
ncbi:MAG: glycosyl transferase family 2 [Bacteroidetes bacterium HGW-Bacteroidetes-21]|jgi:putative flippase GtrA|nr:MAG: glycosyl transferase family 2 [Bacteroidetes bacterium HGW-Bacteroidetes-21]